MLGWLLTLKESPEPGPACAMDGGLTPEKSQQRVALFA
jgi:hypothetical protein